MSGEKPRARVFVLMLALYALVSCAIAFRMRPPAAKAANAPTNEFSAIRARQVLGQLVGNGIPHPVGSPADADVRNAIVGRLTQLGYQPRIQEDFVCNDTGRCADVKNILARLDGREAEPAVMVSAHYDSVPAGPGASDDGAGTVAVLEIARALKASPPLRHTVIFLIDEGEEAGLLGAQAFVRDDPWAKDVRAVVNMDNRGSSGAATMFETGSANEWLMRLYSKTIHHPNTNSLSYTVYKSLPNDTDFTVFKHAGYQGFNFAFLNDVAHYHTPLDDFANADVRSIQSEGEYGLDTVRALADSDLNVGAPSDAVYEDVFGWKTVWWPAQRTIGIALLALALVIFEIAVLARHGTMRMKEFAWGLAAWPLILILGAIFGGALELLLRLAGAMPANWVAHPIPLVLATWALGFAAVALISLPWGQRAGFWGLWSGIWIWWSAAALLVGILNPGLSFVFVVPALGAGIFGLAIVFLKHQPARAGAIAAVIPGVVAAAVGIYPAWFLYSALGGTFLVGITVYVALIAAPLAPLAGTVGGAKRLGFPASAFGIAAIATVAALFVAPFSRASPEAMDIEYSQNADAGRSQWLVYANARKLPLSMRSVAEFQRNPSPAYPWDDRDPFAAPAPALNLPAPTVTVLHRASSRGKITYDVLIKSAREAPEVMLAFAPGSTPKAVTINGHAVPGISKRMLSYTRGWKLYGCVDTPPQGLEMTLILPSTNPVSALLVDQSYGLPRQGSFLGSLRPKTATAIQSGDVTIVTRHVMLNPE